MDSIGFKRLGKFGSISALFLQDNHHRATLTALLPFTPGYTHSPFFLCKQQVQGLEGEECSVSFFLFSHQL